MNSYKLMTWVAGIKTKFHFVPLLLMSTPKISMDVSSFSSAVPEKSQGIEDRDADFLTAIPASCLGTVLCSVQQARGNSSIFENLKVIQVEIALTSLELG